MKVKTFTLAITLISLLTILAIAHYALGIRQMISSPQEIMPNASTIAVPTATEEPDYNYSGSMIPEPQMNLMLPSVNEPSFNPTPVTLPENNETIENPVITPTPTVDPRSTPMAPMKPMEPWKPASPMTAT